MNDPLTFFRKPPALWNCAQSILAAWKDEFGIEDAEIGDFKNYGGGRAPDGVCGALFAANFLLNRKGLASATEHFEKQVGFTTCRKIKGDAHVCCEQCVQTGHDLVRRSLESPMSKENRNLLAMKLKNLKSDVYIPDGIDAEKGLSRTTHLCICAHQDDAEFFAYHGIQECFGHADKWFSAVVVTDGAGSSRADIYANYSDDEMKNVRRLEQRRASVVGEYGAMVQLSYASKDVKDVSNKTVVDDIKTILEIAHPEYLYIHNLADKHDTHVAVAMATLAAVRQLPKNKRPRICYGCEVWRDLDWLNDEDKVMLDVSKRGNLASALNGVFDSQITGGKRYDLAVIGRRLANATFYDAWNSDNVSAITWAMDLSPLMHDDTLSPIAYTTAYIDQFKKDVENRISKFIHP